MAHDALEALKAGLERLAGYHRLLLYRVPAQQPPVVVASVFARGPQEWWQFVEERRALDTGEFTIVASLRTLADAEARIVLDWGSRFGNAFLLLEPLDAAFDLTQPDHLERFVAQANGRDPAGHLADLLRRFYGTWVFWPAPEGQGPLRAQLDLSRHATLAEALQAEMIRAFPPPAFATALRDLVTREEELFASLSPVARVVIPFFSRLGLPIPYDPRLVTRAFRQAVNEGLTWVREPADDGPFYRGPSRPVPESLSDEEFEALVR